MDFDKKRGFLGIIIIILLIVALYLSFVPEDCDSFACFREHIVQCKPTVYINEEPEASWEYRITGAQNNKCTTEVTLLNAKEGDLELRQYEGHSMTCMHDLGVLVYPEKNLDTCHGQLKEDLQNVIIEKLYRYIIDNIDEINEELRQI